MSCALDNRTEPRFQFSTFQFISVAVYTPEGRRRRSTLERIIAKQRLRAGINAAPYQPITTI